MTVWFSRASAGRRFLPTALAAVVASLAMMPVSAEAARVENPVAAFSGIDKITGRITNFDVYIGETVQFGALQVTPKVCYSRDDTEAQKVTSFVEVDEITLDRKIRRIFTGWMFASSPGLNALEHPVYDVWVIGCHIDDPNNPNASVATGVEGDQPAELPSIDDTIEQDDGARE